MWGLLWVSGALALTLDEAWERARSVGDDAALIEAQRDAGETIRGQAVSALMPRVSVTGGYTINQHEAAFDISRMLPEELAALVGETEPFVINQKTYWSGSATVVQPLFSGSAVPAWFAAGATARAATAQAESSLDQLEVGVARAYWGAFLAGERVRVASDSVARAEAWLKLAQERERLGAGRAIDTAQAGVALARARKERATAEAARVEAEAGLGRLLGLAEIDGLSRPVPAAVGVDSAEAAVARVSDAPSVRAAEERATAARQARTATDLGWVPTVSARFTEAYSENAGFSGEEWNWQAAITADWNLFDGGYRIAKQREAAFNQEVAARAASREVAQAEADTRALWAQWEGAREAQVQARAERALAEEALRLAEATYALGAMTFLDLWTARQQRDAAELGEIAAEMTLDLAGRALRARVGG